LYHFFSSIELFDQVGDTSHSSQDSVKTLAHPSCNISGGLTSHSMAQRKPSAQQIEQQHLFTWLHSFEGGFDIFYSEFSFLQFTQQGTLLLGVEQPLETTFLEHPIFSSSLMLSKHSGPKSDAKSIDARNPFDGPTGPEALENAPESGLRAIDKFCSLIK
jgi:hypothetical protein